MKPEKILEDFRRHPGFSGTAGVSVPGSVECLALYAQLVQQRIIVPLAEVVRNPLRRVSRQEQRDRQMTGSACANSADFYAIIPIARIYAI